MLSDAQRKALRGIIKKPHVNSSCIGCSVCTAISGDVFEIDDNGLSHVKNLPNYSGQDVDDAITACPVQAISWQNADESGVYLDGVTEHDNTGL